MLNPVTDGFLNTLRAELPAGAFRPVTAAHTEEPRGRYAGQVAAVLAPATPAEVALILRAASAARVGVVPYGGGTGLVAGQVRAGAPAPILLSLERMTAIRGVWPDENVMIAEAGAVLADVHAAAEARDRLFPLSYGSEGSARIGGALSVNSGGVNVLRYGNARDLCLGIEAVLPNGDILHGLKRLRKDNTGYDIRNLLIGSEGTLGVITAASLRLHPRPAATGTAFLAVPDPAAALSLLARARDAVGEAVSAFEVMSGVGLGFLDEAAMDLRRPYADIPDWAVLIELGLARSVDPDAVLSSLLEDALAAGEILDGVIAQNATQRDDFWALREGIPLANRRIGAVASHDISLPLSAIPEFLRRCDLALGRFGPLRTNAFGHLGDGNLHYNVFAPRGVAAGRLDHLRAGVTGTIHDLVHEMDGSFSAEHGIGRLKVGDLQRYGDPARLNVMRAIKNVLDPQGIMNPGAVLPESG
jgi:FAD/FMN-containing dehydrogenase